MLSRNLFAASLALVVGLGAVGCGTKMEFQRETFTTQASAKLDIPAPEQEKKDPPAPEGGPVVKTDPSIPELPIPMEPGDNDDEMPPETVETPLPPESDVEAIVHLRRLYVVGVEKSSFSFRPKVVRIEYQGGLRVDITKLLKGEVQELPVVPNEKFDIRKIFCSRSIESELEDLSVVALVYRLDRRHSLIKTVRTGPEGKPLYIRSKYLPFYRSRLDLGSDSTFDLNLSQRKPASAEVQWRQQAPIYLSRRGNHWLFPIWSPRHSVLLGIR